MIFMIKSVNIPKERIAVLIGEYGSSKKTIEKETHTKILIEDEVIIEGESLDVLTAENIVKAIGRGFSPENALKLADEEILLDIIHLPKTDLERLRSRIIGAKGKARRTLEMLTDTNISVYGKTVSIIGKYENVFPAREAVEKLIKGFSHKSVYAFLEGKHQNRKN
ncbi:MAG: RNA-processing protein [Candidatus Aenigmarchaeota archaeon]|nr:RNA-processing protein [Candidatus Aenigmarchaeota archaeon]